VVQDAVRPEFYAASRDTATVRLYSLFAPAGYFPLKGIHWLLRAVALVRRRYPAVTLRVASMPVAYHRPAPGYARYLGALIKDLDLRGCVQPLGLLSAAEMVHELLGSHAFVLSSMVENSPNSLAEAMVVGTPCVAPYVGGVPSMVRDTVDALCYEPGDHRMLAARICELFADDALARRLALNAQTVARPRHGADRVVAEQTEVYGEVLRRTPPT
jgi:glycosyltransferase involved in cell wall biosynthesis